MIVLAQWGETVDRPADFPCALHRRIAVSEVGPDLKTSRGVSLRKRTLQFKMRDPDPALVPWGNPKRLLVDRKYDRNNGWKQFEGTRTQLHVIR